jgi:uncharacterized protein (DUF488 family)
MPHFAREALERSLPQHGLRYLHLRALGGWRKPVAGSPNGGWRSRSFQGYADHMASTEFREGLLAVTEQAARDPTALMCAEALWWRCHRMLISDALTVVGWQVLHIGAGPTPEPHRLTPFATVEAGELTYPPAQAALRL